MLQNLFCLVAYFWFAESSPLKLDETSQCVDGVNNLLTINSIDNGSLPIQVRNVQILLYDIFNETSCHEGRPNLKMPGWVKFISGEMEVTRDIVDLQEAKVQPTISFLGFYLCKEGQSRLPVFPNRFCNFDWSTYVPDYFTEVLSKKGTHTISEMAAKTNFTEMMEVPPSVSFLGVTLLRIVRGRYSTEIRMELKGEPILHVGIPSDEGLFHVGYY